MFEAIFRFILSVLLYFFYIHIYWCIYGYFSPHVGFQLPELSYLNMLAIHLTITAFLDRLDGPLKLHLLFQELVDEDKKDPWFLLLTKLFGMLTIWGVAYLIHLILF